MLIFMGLVIAICFIGPCLIWFLRNFKKYMQNSESHTMNKWTVRSFIYGYPLGIIIIIITVIIYTQT